MESTEAKIVVIDTDAGIDDAWAILMLLAAIKEKSTDLKVIGVTCIFGNSTVDHTCTNVLRIFQSTKTFDIPVYKGAASPLIGLSENSQKTKQFFGADGFGGAEHNNTPSAELINKENAVSALNRIVSENKGKVSLLCFGPLTNIALAIRTYSTFEENVKEILIMGGNYQAIGNSSDTAEFNFHADPEAAHIVLSSAIPQKVLIPWETCIPLTFSLDWRDNVLGACDNASVQLLNHAERPLRAKPTFFNWMPCDQVVAAVVLNQAVVMESVDTHLTVELHGQLTRGQVVVGHKTKRRPNVALVKKIDKNMFAQLLLSVHTL